MNEAKSIVYGNVMYKGHLLSVTSRDGGDPQESFDMVVKFLDSNEVAPFQQYRNLYKDPTVKQAEGLGGVEVIRDEEDLGLINYPPNAKDRVPGQVFEVEVDNYTTDAEKVAFWKAGGDWPVHTHYLNDIGTKMMEKLFGKGWRKHFSYAPDPKPIPGGALIIRLLTSDARNKQDNYYVNLVNQRRPE